MSRSKDDNKGRSTAGSEGNTKRGAPWSLVAAGLVAAVLLTFVLQNTEQVQVSWLFFEASSPLWSVIVLSGVVALVIEHLAALAWRRRKKEPKDSL